MLETVQKGDKLIVGIAGKKLAGKDTAANFLVDRGFTKKAFADPLKKHIYTLNPILRSRGLFKSALRVKNVVDKYGWDYCKANFPEIRRLLQIYGTEVGREQIDSNLWVHLTFADIDQLRTDVVISDMRFMNEYEALKARGGIAVKIQNHRAETSLDNHASEAGLPDDLFDYIIPNNTYISDLYCEIEVLLMELHESRHGHKPY